MDALDASRIVRGLYQGSVPAPGHLVRGSGFSILVLAAKEYQPLAGWYPGVRVVHAPLDDAVPSSGEKRTIRKAGLYVASRVAVGKRVLVTCQQGRNRSGIITAVAMRCLFPKASPEEIVDHIRRARPDALTNEAFVRAFRRGEFGGKSERAAWASAARGGG